MNLIERLIDVVAPHSCTVCQKEGDLVCPACFCDAFPPLPGRCYRCYKLMPQSRTCDKCRRHSKLHHVWVSTDYDGVAKDLLHKLKFGRAKAAAQIVAMHLDEQLPYLKPDVIVTCVPTASGRMRVRGYDQASLMAKEFAHKRGLLYVRLLGRLGNQRQVGASRQTRLKQLEGAFVPINRNLIQKANILLIDDVLTTGATLEAAAKELKKSGAKTINGAVFAQSL